LVNRLPKSSQAASRSEAPVRLHPRVSLGSRRAAATPSTPARMQPQLPLERRCPRPGRSAGHEPPNRSALVRVGR
jgi:hypothetical protein